MRRVGDIDHDVGQAERLAARRRQQFVDLAPADPAAGSNRPLQPHAAGNDAIDLDAAVPFDPHLDERARGDEVGLARIADDEIADLLGVQADAVERVGRLDAAALQLVVR